MSAVSVTVQLVVKSGHPSMPPQLITLKPASGLASRVTVDPAAKDELQVVPQLIPLGLLVTEPVPWASSLLTVSVCCGTAPNVAVTDVSSLTVTVQVPVPEHAPPHPSKLEPEAGFALSVTVVPLS
jgi:hypothetical protein